jgi:DNA adenine methylase
MNAPFPWFGGKSRAAPLIWSRIGSDCGNYVEPFFGSGAVWHNRPAEYRGWATVNDLDGNIANAWRAMKANPQAVAEAACAPVHEADLHARHLWLVNNLSRLAGRLCADPEYNEPRAAGWWIWGACSWIRGGWCDGSGPWSAVPDDEGVPTLTRDAGTGVNRQLPHLGGGRGVNRKLQGDRLAWLNQWFAALSASLEGVRIACGDWKRICSPLTMTRNGTAAVVLDPPYSQTDAVYAHDSSTVAHEVREWARANGGNRKLRIALCGHDGEHNELTGEGWTVETWRKGGGYQGADDRERIWFSPHCLKAASDDLFGPQDSRKPRLTTAPECD